MRSRATLMAPSLTTWRLWSCILTLTCIALVVTAEDLIILPLSPVAGQETIYPDTDPIPLIPVMTTTAIAIPMIATVAAISSSRSFASPLLSSSEHDSFSRALHQTSPTDAGRLKPNPPKLANSNTLGDQDPRRPPNEPADSLKLARMPLKESCDILRQFYNNTGGIGWSRQDGWQFMDSVTTLAVSTGKGEEEGEGKGGIKHGIKRGGSSAQALISKQAAKDKSRDKHRLDGTTTDASSAPGPLHPAQSQADSGPAGGVERTNTFLDVTANTDPDNCCGWYGVVCIGPDDVIPPPWAPYDGDLIIDHSLITGSSHGGNENVLKLKKRSAPGGLDNYHDRNQRRHYKDGGGHGHDIRSGGSRGFEDSGMGAETRMREGEAENRHQADDGNSEREQPVDSSESGTGNGGNSESNDGRPMVPPPTSYKRSMYNSGSPMGDWYIVGLHLNFNGLTGPMPEELGGLVNLMALDLGNNELTGQIPESYGNLTRLKRLDVSSNLIMGTFPKAIIQMTSIQELELKNNYLTGVLPAGLTKLKQLTELSIANNEFEGMLPTGLFGSLNKLRVIDISQNGFTGEIDPEIGALTGLLKFSARANDLKGKIPKELGNCKQIQVINLGDNHISGEIPDTLYGLQNLRVLDMPDNKLTGPVISKIGNMRSLTRLVLSHNHLSGSLPVEIQNLTRMEYMALNYNNFDGMFPTAVAPLQMTVCLVLPNAFTACPPISSVEMSITLAYQCNLDCKDHVIHQDIYGSISLARPLAHKNRSLLLFSMAFLVSTMATIHVL